MIKRVIKKIYWHLKCRKFKSFGDNPCMSIDAEIIGENYISIGDDFSAGKNLKLQAWSRYNGKMSKICPSLIIGNSVTMMSNCQISCANEIIVKDGVLMGDNVFITDSRQYCYTRILNSSSVILNFMQKDFLDTFTYLANSL